MMAQSSSLPPSNSILEIEYHRPKLTDYQLAHIFHPARIVIIEASTKSGKTVGCIAWLIERAILNGKLGNQYWWVAPSTEQARIAYGRTKRGLQPDILRVPNETAMMLTLKNGAAIKFKTGEDPDTLYGENVHDCVMDEVTRMRETAWWAIRTTLTATKGSVRMIGNLKGKLNWAYKLARKAEAGEQDMHTARINSKMAVDAGILDAEDIAAAKRDLPPLVYKELYECIPTESGSNPFGYEHIRNCIAVLSTKPARVFGVDLAKGERPEGDWTVVTGLDFNGYVCKFERWQSPWTETKIRIKSIVGNTKTLVDSTGAGDPVLEDLQRSYGGMFEGYHFTQSSKQKLMEGLAIAIQQQKVHFPEGVITNELESFEFEYSKIGVKYNAPAGMHDDCVCSLALAVQMMPKSVSMWDRMG